jgi:hypothetical protein
VREKKLKINGRSPDPEIQNEETLKCGAANLVQSAVHPSDVVVRPLH